MQALALDFSAVVAHAKAAPPAPVPPAMTGLRKHVWLLLYTEGGMWRVAEIAHRLGLSPKKLPSELGSMVREGFLVRRRETTVDGDVLVRYGVSGGCSIPRGVTPREIEELLRLAVGQRA